MKNNMKRKGYFYLLLTFTLWGSLYVVSKYVLGKMGAQLLGTKYAGASLASLINSLNPVTMTVFAAILLHEAMTLRKVLGIALALCGVYVIIGTGAQEISVAGVAFSLFKESYF